MKIIKNKLKVDENNQFLIDGYIYSIHFSAKYINNYFVVFSSVKDFYDILQYFIKNNICYVIEEPCKMIYLEKDCIMCEDN